MDIRDFARGTVSWEHLEDIGLKLVSRLGQDQARIRFLNADNWLSTPLVVDDAYFVKVITSQNVMVHSLMTRARNAGAMMSGTIGFFGQFEDPRAMGEHELKTISQMREIGINAPDTIDHFEHDGSSVVVLEYLDEFRTYDQLAIDEQRMYAEDILRYLALMHENDFAHGDIRDENILIANGEVYFIDATSIQQGQLNAAQAYDVASVLAVLGPRIGYRESVSMAVNMLGAGIVRDAQRYAQFVYFRPDHTFDIHQLQDEIQHVVGQKQS